MTISGRVVRIELANKQVEEHAFASNAEALARLKFVAEALTWIGTPFRDCMDVKGRTGGVDCAMLMTRCAIDTGLLAPFDPRPYPPRWHQHQDKERFLEWVEEKLGAQPIVAPRFGDIAIWRFGRCYSHGGIIINSAETVHAYYAAKGCVVSPLTEPLLCFLPTVDSKPRQVRYFDLWGRVEG